MGAMGEHDPRWPRMMNRPMTAFEEQYPKQAQRIETLLAEIETKDKEIKRLRSVMQDKNDALSKAWGELAEYRERGSIRTFSFRSR